MPNWKKVILSGSNASLNLLYVKTGVTGSSFTGSFRGDGAGIIGVISSSYAITASYALNGGSGPTVSASYAATASYVGNRYYAHFTQSSAAATWTFNHNLGYRYPVITVYDSKHLVVVPQEISASSINQSIIYFPTSVAGYASATVGSIFPVNQGAIRTIGLTIDGGGSAITTGIKGDITIPFSGIIMAWYLIADVSGNIVIDVWKDAFANYPPTISDSITGTEKPTLTGQSSNSDTNLTTWITTVTAGDVMRFNVDSAATVTRVNLVIKIITI